MYVKDVLVQNQVGLHARPATFFIQKANEFKSSIWVEKEERRVNAKSLLGVLSLGIMVAQRSGSLPAAPMKNRPLRSLLSLLNQALPSNLNIQLKRHTVFSSVCLIF